MASMLLLVTLVFASMLRASRASRAGTAGTSGAAGAWTQGYLAEYFHSCEPGSFVDALMADASLEPEIICSDKIKDGCDTPQLDFTNGRPGCAAWRGTQCGFEGGFPGVKIPDQFSARYTADLAVPATGDYTFCLDSDDGSKLWIDGVEVVDDNSLHGIGWPECSKTPVALTKDTPAKIQVNYFENTGLAGLRLYWKQPGAADPPIIIPAAQFSHKANGGTATRAGLLGEYFRQCHTHENLASLDLNRKQPVSHTVVRSREINYDYCSDFWCPDYQSHKSDGEKSWWEEDTCQEDPSRHASCVPYKDYFAMRITGYLLLDAIQAGQESMNCTFRLTSSDGANFYLGQDGNGNAPLVNHDGLHDWWTDKSEEGHFVVTRDDIKVGGRWQGGYVPFRLEYFNNADEHALKLEMKGCQDLTTYANFAPLRLTEFKLPADTDVNATNPPDRQCKTCKPDQDPAVGKGCYPASAAGNASTGVEPADKTVFEAGRTKCLEAGEALWCDQVALTTQVGDGKCDPVNNVAGCWDGGDCCRMTCQDGSKHTCPLKDADYPFCAASLMPGLDAEFFEDVSIGDVGTLVERTQVPTIWWPSSESPMQYFNASGIIKEWDHFYIRLSGFLKIPTSGQYTFYLAADDGATLYIDGERQVDDTGVHGMAVEQRPIWLSAGFHEMQVNMQEKTGFHGLELEVRGPTFLDPDLFRKQPVRKEWLWNGNPCGDEAGFGVDIPTDARDIRVPKSPLCGARGICEPVCPKSSEHGACWNHTCECDPGYMPAIANATDQLFPGSVTCKPIPPAPKGPAPVNVALIVLLVLLATAAIGAGVCFWKRKQLKHWALWKFASARLYKSMAPSLDARDEMEEDEGETRGGKGEGSGRGGGRGYSGLNPLDHA